MNAVFPDATKSASFSEFSLLMLQKRNMRALWKSKDNLKLQMLKKKNPEKWV